MVSQGLRFVLETLPGEAFWLEFFFSLRRMKCAQLGSLALPEEALGFCWDDE